MFPRPPAHPPALQRLRALVSAAATEARRDPQPDLREAAALALKAMPVGGGT